MDPVKPIPARLGRYALVRRLGIGGTAEVFEGRMTAAAGVIKPVCVKRILPAYVSDPAFVRLFVSEARMSMALAHGNIAQVFDFGHEGDDLYIVRELVEGTALFPVMATLSETGARFPPRLAVHLVRELLAGLHHAHTHVRRGGRVIPVVHGAVSPWTILVSYEGQVKLVDFGLARAAMRDPARLGMLEDGSADFVSPEQLAGEAVDPRSDVYGAGAVLHALLCGVAPPRGDAAAEVRLHRLDPELNRRLSKAVQIALAPRPDDRWPDALAFQTALGEVAAALGPAAGEDELGVLVRHTQADKLRAAGKEVEVPANYAEDLPKKRAAPARRRSRRARVVGVAAASMALAAAGLFLWGPRGETPPPTRSLEVRSRPPGARILVDGKDTGRRTNAVLPDFPAGRTVNLALELENHRPATRPVAPHESQVALVLEPAAVAERPLVAERPPTKQVTRREPGAVVAREPLVSRGLAGERWTIDLSRTGLPVDRLRKTTVEIEPDHAHHLTVHSQVMFDRARSLGTLFVIRRDEAGALLGIDRLSEGGALEVPTGTARIEAFIADVSSRGVSGHMRMSVLRGAHLLEEIRLDPAADIPALNQLGVTVVENVDTNRVHRVRYVGPEDGPPLFLLGTGLGVFVLTVRRDDMIVLLRPGEEALMHYAGAVHLFHLVEPGGQAATGQAIVEVIPAPRNPEPSID
jgi:eukaryotic-like serine/threonine-protein kinase